MTPDEPTSDALDPEPETAGDQNAATAKDWTPLLDHLRAARGFDFHGYKPNSLARRIRKRMAALGVETFSAYQDYLEVHQDEFPILFNTILINVTAFFRDPEAWDVIRTTVVPQLLANKPLGEPIRAWSAGCASGEEAYTLAIILAEAMGLDDFRQRAKIYATDVDEEALAAARHATYTARQVQGVPAELLGKYFERVDGLFVFRKDLRRQVIFGRHDLINDAPISRIDLLVCRNTLMYFNAETQSKILQRFHFALNEGGFLFLGRAETLMTHGQTFVPVDLKRRVSRKIVRGVGRDRAAPLNSVNNGEHDRPSPSARIRDAALDASPSAQLVIDPAGLVAFANDRARLLFNLRGSDVGRPLRDLQLSYRPIELRSVIEQVEAERRPVAIKEVEWRTSAGDPRWLDLHIAPLTDNLGALLGMSVTFTDISGYRRLQRELEQSHQELETAYEELQSTNEELEATNGELQSTVEELETTNDELQSTNEELETMNEELQSTNEELQTMNDELRQRGDELNGANAFLASVLRSLQSGVAVVDRELKILAWNRRAEELWGLRTEEVSDQRLPNLDFGLPVERLRPALRTCLNGDAEVQQVTLDAINRRGRSIRCQVTCTPLRGMSDDIRGAILLMDEAQAIAAK